ncbi:hypothetical protein FRC11_000666 [Ceratobasidium sp. 423]|nr:hypothetical protein FRC11_000666 [Ceratobasidium sp. 423]
MGNQKPNTRKKTQSVKRAGARYAETLRKYAGAAFERGQLMPAATQPPTVVAPPESHDQEDESEADTTNRKKRKRDNPLVRPTDETQPGPSNQPINSSAPVIDSTPRDMRPAAVLQAPAQQGEASSKASSQIHALQAIRAAGAACQAEDHEMTDNASNDNPIPPAGKGKGRDTESIGDVMQKIEEIHSDEGGKVAVEALITLLQKVMDLKSTGDEQNDKTQSKAKAKGKSKAPNPANDPLIPWEQDKPFEIPNHVKHREVEQNALLGYIRFLVYAFLGCESPSDPLPPAPPEEEVHAPTPKGLWFRWHESEHSLFNQTACRIVAEQVLADLPGIQSTMNLEEIQELVTAHLVYLKACWNRQNDPNSESKEARRLRRCAADTRKRTLYGQRIAVIENLPGVSNHSRLIAALGIEGTSSDEEDPSAKGVYIIHRRVPLSEEVNHLKRQLDQAYAIHFKGLGSRGNPARVRVDRGLKSKRPFVIKGLPDTCLDPGELMTLGPLQREILELRRLDYDFNFPKELLEAPTY